MKHLRMWLMRRLAGGENLTSTVSPYDDIRRLLAGHRVTGIVDGGASNGRIGARLLRFFPEAHAYGFEPNPIYSDELAAREKTNPRFHASPLALSDREETLTLHLNQSAGTNSLFKPTDRLKNMCGEAVREVGSVEVKCVRLDDWAKERIAGGVQMIKLDIQGAELKALRGASRILDEEVKLIYAEVSFHPLYEGGTTFGEVDGFLREHGFVLYNLYKVRADAKGMLDQANAIFLHAGRLGVS